MQHNLKISKDRLANLLIGRKKCEIRLNDRDYQTGDTLGFDSLNPMHELSKGSYLKNDVVFRITHIHSGLGMADGYVVLSLERVGL